MKKSLSFRRELVIAAAAASLFVACSESKNREPVTTYKYDPLKDDAGISDSKAATAAEESQKSAEKKTSKIAKAGRKPAAVNKTVPLNPDYVVQIGAFTKRENADKLLNELKAKSYPVHLKTLDHKDFGQMFLVRLQATKDKTEAETLSARLRESEKLNPTIIIPKTN